MVSELVEEVKEAVNGDLGFFFLLVFRFKSERGE